ncbi:MAG: carbohydrate ABC transporter permease [Lachnospiraceae bacterium]|nr:carbohydrate ABC transporter permease [Lachnospiraceae bacterium]
MANINSEKSYRAHIIRNKIIRYVVLVFLTIVCLFPLYVMFINSTHESHKIAQGLLVLPGTWFFKNLFNTLNDGSIPILRGLLNSLIISACCAVLTTYFSTLTAYAVHAYDFKGRKAIQTFILAVMMIPSQVTALGFYDLMKTFGLLDNYIPLIVPTIAAPVVYFFMLQYMQGALPLEIVEAARIDGSNELRTFNSIVLPIMKPAIAVQAIFAFVTNWNNYFTPNLIIKSQRLYTLPIVIAKLRAADFASFDNGKIYMAMVLSILPVVVVYVFLSRYIIQGVAVGSVKG